MRHSKHFFVWLLVFLGLGYTFASCPSAPYPYEPLDTGEYKLLIEGNTFTACGVYSLLIDPQTLQDNASDELFYPFLENVMLELNVSREQLTPLFLEVEQISGPIALDEIPIAFKVFGPTESYIVAFGYRLDRLYDLMRFFAISFPIPQPPENVYTPPTFEPESQEPIVMQERERYTWGDLTVVVEHSEGGNFYEERARIVDSNNSTITEIQDSRIYEVSFHEIDGQAPEELVIDTYSGGAHCCFTTHMYQLDDPTKEMYTGKSFFSLEDLDGDGKEEVISRSMVYLEDIPFCCQPFYETVGVWNGENFVDRTALFPAFAEANMAQNRTELLEANSTQDEVGQKSAAFGFYANAVMLNQGEQAWQWLEQNAASNILEWLLPFRETIDQDFTKLAMTTEP